jgi:hypothetical protein
VRDNLKQCINGHFSCRTNADDVAYMPTRVLDLGVVDDERAPVRLVESTHIVDDRSYACLSHRWDSLGRTIITEKATYEKHRDCIRFEDLGLPYRETVHIMRRLCMRYLWIDSLCIIQDSAKDWESESKTMATVYNRAVFTLARQCDSTTSLRCIPDHTHLVSDPRISPPVYTRPAFKHLWNQLDGLYKFQLAERGWIYQERLLSPRTIHFSDEEIFWECYKNSSCQCDRGVPHEIALHYELPKFHHAKALLLGDLTSKPEVATLRKRWRQIVEEYSGLDLTKSSDKLYAIQGCADQIGERLNESYLFGLWQGDLLGDLAWGKGCKKPRPTGQHCIPTWSWASTDGQVSYVNINHVLSHIQLAIEPGPDESHLTPSILLLTGRILPASLKIARYSMNYDRETWSWNGLRIEVNSDFSKEDSKSTWLTKPGCGSDFFQDFEMRTADWDCETQYDISLALLGRSNIHVQHQHCLVLWRYGRGIPGPGVERETVDKHPIYQRIGMLYMNVDLQRRNHRAIVDWSKADEVTVAIE